MKKTLLVCSVLSIFCISACTPENDALNLPPGNYRKDVKSTDANGVTTEHVTSTDVSEDQDGQKSAIVNSKTTEKPPGFFNGLFHKTTTDQSTEVIQEN